MCKGICTFPHSLMYAEGAVYVYIHEHIFYINAIHVCSEIAFMHMLLELKPVIRL